MRDEAPVRWIDDADAPADLRDDLRAEREAPRPALDYAAGLAALEAKIGGSGGPSGSHGGGGGGASAPGGGVTTSLGAPSTILVGVGLALTVAGIALYLVWPASSAPTSAGPTPASTSSAPADHAERTADAAPVEVPAIDEDAPPGEPDLAASEALPEPESVHAVPARPMREPSDPDRLRREMEQLELARRALETDPARALALVRAARAEFGDGTFGAERDAIGALALFSLGRLDEARPRARRLLRRDPDGLYADRLREALATP